MDWFNSAYWANHAGAYDIWKTVYPPLAFVFLHVFSLHKCYVNDAMFARDCDVVGLVTLFIFYGLDVILVYKTYLLQDRATALVRGTAVALGLPMLYTLERGNLIIPCFAFFVLGCGPILRAAWLRWLALAVSINFKPYIVVMLIAQLIKRRWRWAEGCGIALIGVYLVSFAFERAGTPQQLFNDITAFSSEAPNSFLLSEAFYSTSYAPVIALIRSDFPLTSIIGSRMLETLGLVLPLLIRIGQVGVVACFAGATLRPASVSKTRLGALSFALLITSTDPGGYTQLFLVFLVFLEKWRGKANIIMIIIAYILCISIDYEAISISHYDAVAFISGKLLNYHLGVGVGDFVRPLLILFIEYCLIAATFADLWRSRAAPGQRPMRIADVLRA